MHNFIGQLYLSSNNNPQLYDEARVPPEPLGQEFIQNSNFIGNNAITSVVDVLSCDETHYKYFNSVTQLCSTILNFNRLNTLNFANVPSSRTNRWTIEGWIYVEIVQQFTSGINITWVNHLGISLIRDQTSVSTLNVICFPQGYRDDLTGINGNDVYNLYNQAINKGMSQEQFASSNWIFFRCAVDLHTGLFYISNKSSINIINETLYGNVKNVISYRFFNLPTQTNLSFFNMNLNNSRIFMRTFQLYTDFIPQYLMNLKYRDMSLYANLNFFPLVFTVDFDQFSGTNIPYTVVNPITNTKSTLTNSLSITAPISYSTYPTFYVINLCDFANKGDGNNNCVAISTPTDCPAPGNFCYDKVNSQVQNFWCNANNYINISNYSCNSACPSGFTRLPDSQATVGYCLKNCVLGNFNSCPSSSTNLLLSNYQSNTNFNCNTGYTRVFYNCLSSNIIVYSNLMFLYIGSMYINNFFSTLNITNDLVVQNISNYYLEFWFMIDNINPPSSSSGLTYFLAPPHKIFIGTDLNYKYSNINVNNWMTYYSLPSISLFEWNRIIIMNYNNLQTNTSQINVYVNYNFLSPEINLNVSIVDMSIKGILFCSKAISPCIINSIDYASSTFWGNAWYKNIRIWDYSLSSLSLIQSFGRTYNSYINLDTRI